MVLPFYVELGISRDAVERFFVNYNWRPFALDKLTLNVTRLGQSSKLTSTKEILLRGIIR